MDSAQKMKGFSLAGLLRGRGKRAAWVLLLAALGLLAGGTQVLGVLRPAGAALIVAAAVAGWPLLPAGLGCLAAILLGGVSLAGAPQLIAPALALFACLVMSWAGRKPGIRAGALLLLAARLAALPFRLPLLYDILLFVFETGLALALYYCFATAMTTLSAPKKAGRESGVFLALGLGALLAGVPAISVGSFSLPLFLGAALSLFGGLAGGAAFGAAAGLGAGAVLALVGGLDPALLGGLGLCGLAAGAVRPLSRWAGLTAWTLAAVLIGMVVGHTPEGLLPWGSALAAMIVAAAVPAGLWHDIERRLAAAPAAEEDSAQWVARMREQAVARLNAFSDCFRELGRVFDDATTTASGIQSEEVSPVLEAVAEDVCRHCARRQLCWETQFMTTWNHFVTALARPRAQATLWPEDFSQEFRDGCLHFEEVLTALRAVWGLYRVRAGYARRIDESRELVSRQLTGVGGVMADLAGQLELRLRFRQDLNDQVRRALALQGCFVHRVAVQEGFQGTLAVQVEARGCGGRRRCTLEYARVLSQVLNRPMRRVGQGCAGGHGACRLEFREAGALQVSTAAVQLSQTGDVCGDGWCCRAMDVRSYLMALSDGMGSGPEAARESAATLSMLRHFYEAGFSDEVICKTINSILLLRSGHEMFATVDLCLIDLVGCRARFIKTGAAPSFLLRAGQVQTLSKPTLPLGILENVQPAVLHRYLEDQDVIVLMSDGAAGDGQWVARELPALAEMAPQAMAQALLDLSKKHQPEPDDRTVVVARVQQLVTDDQLPVNRRLEHWRARVNDLEDKEEGV